MLEILGKCTIDIDPIVPNTTSFVVSLIKIGIPILLIIFGMLDLGKAVMSNDEKEMKGAQSKLIKRCLYAVLVFFVVAIVQFLVGVLAKSDNNDTNINKNSITDCIDCFVNGNNCSQSK